VPNAAIVTFPMQCSRTRRFKTRAARSGKLCQPIRETIHATSRGKRSAIHTARGSARTAPPAPNASPRDSSSPRTKASWINWNTTPPTALNRLAARGLGSAGLHRPRYPHQLSDRATAQPLPGHNAENINVARDQLPLVTIPTEAVAASTCKTPRA